MSTDAPEILQQRVSRVERTQWVLVLVVLALSMAVVFREVRAPRVLQAERVELIDAGGTVRAELILRDGQPGLYLKDVHGVDRVSVFHDSSASGMMVADSSGTTRVGAVQFAHGGGGFALHGPASRGAAVLYLKGAGSLRFFDSAGTVTNQVTAERP